ncbi:MULTISPECIES: phytoene/squalene synthase family protein [Saccharopolyspora]|uniref:Phytoene synthase n=2 Tax=Saccharopolyspora TaxID=1835 RepID=A0A1I6UEL2_9PSEU|nr:MULTISPECIES: phytoene/squalene synthase family protein [Saccharopolyspora]TWG07615.1 phytoene synthase [Saccharopolyspora dendranthemae]SFS99851.1 phytoene synthase [Saccharopolyspora flava]
MRDAELDAAGITDPGLRQAYQRCRGLNARHGRTYFLATRLLPRGRRPAVHALYGFARWADDIVDEPRSPASTGERGAELAQLGRELLTGLDRGSSRDQLIAPVVDTARRYGLHRSLFEDFLTSMRTDLSVTDYPDRAALDRYMRGSAEAIGLQLLPVLGTTGPPEHAAPHAAALGKAFQLTNFLRDVAEDLDRDRVYLPADELAAHGVDRELLTWCRQHRRTDPRVRRALAEQHAAAREVYRFARKGIELLEPVSRPCIETACTLYAEILDRIEEQDFAVFHSRAVVGRWRRGRVAAAGLLRAALARQSRGAPRPGRAGRGDRMIGPPIGRGASTGERDDHHPEAGHGT